ncbi:MAG: 7-carboxy-7-deazaguanine synthase [Acidobacteriaceae bacterium]|jgi:7-carboxy-7-deazaguanine synthase|nr:7-carboxy-7-deazaguanine synthase [Acidobacteriaceae bacterium]
MYLIEIYKSVQGESSFAGLPCIFVRLAGCNLRCSWCDSEYTFKGGYKQSLDEVEAAVAALTPVRLVEFTGGEPMLQERELVPLMERMLNKGYTLMIETSGERLLGNVPKDVHKIVDVKCPGSGEGGTFRMENVDALTKRDEVKFVISDRGDYEFAREFTREHGLEERAGAVLFSPAFKKAPSLERSTSNCALDPRVLVEWMLADGVPARLSLQIHKYIWEPQKKGV